jgi:hypothetical protein
MRNNRLEYMIGMHQSRAADISKLTQKRIAKAQISLLDDTDTDER